LETENFDQDSPFVAVSGKSEKEKTKISQQGETGGGGPHFGDLPPIDWYEDLSGCDEEEDESYFGNQELSASLSLRTAPQMNTYGQKSKNTIEVRGKQQEQIDRPLKVDSAQMSVVPVFATQISVPPKHEDRYQNLRKLLVIRWNDLTAKGQVFKSHREKKFFTWAKLHFPDELNLIYLTLLKLEKDGKDFGGYAVGDPITKLELKWTGIREVAAQHFGDKAMDMAILSPEEFQAKQQRRQNEIKSVLDQKQNPQSAALIRINEEVSIDDQVKVFEERFQGEDRIHAIQKWCKGLFRNLEGRPALLAAASFWFISDERKSELSTQSEQEAIPIQSEIRSEVIPAPVVKLQPAYLPSEKSQQEAYEKFIPEQSGLPFDLRDGLESMPVVLSWNTRGPPGGAHFSRLGFQFMAPKSPPVRAVNF
jgi:hypothetical protein